MNRIYISGGITGVENYKEKFAHAENALSCMIIPEYHLDNQQNIPQQIPYIFNPAKVEGVKDWNDGMCKTIINLFDCDTICFLDEWYKSKGCRIEYFIARCLGLNVVRYSEEKGILDYAESIEVFTEESRRCLEMYDYMRIPEIKAPEKLEVNKELVNHPEHYNGGSDYECYKVLKNWLTPEQYKGFLLGNSLKYLCRLGKKDNPVQEIKKSKWYEEKLIEEFGNGKNN